MNNRQWGDTAHVQFQLRKYDGAITVYTDHLTPPLKEVPPFELMSQDQNYYEVSMCGLEKGLMYIALQGEHGCSNYKIGLFAYNDSDVEAGRFDPCEEMRNEGASAAVCVKL